MRLCGSMVSARDGACLAWCIDHSVECDASVLSSSSSGLEHRIFYSDVLHPGTDPQCLLLLLIFRHALCDRGEPGVNGAKFNHDFSSCNLLGLFCLHRVGSFHDYEEAGGFPAFEKSPKVLSNRSVCFAHMYFWSPDFPPFQSLSFTFYFP